jgi:beta-galactosidase
MDRLRRHRRWNMPVYVVALICLMAPITLVSQNAAPPPPAILLGTGWYPEQWPESRWDADLTLMQQAGVRMVRVGEFAWSRMEPSEGQYDLDWLDRAITAAAKHGIYIVLGTPTPTPPAWMTQRYPEILRMSEDGRLAEHGNRQHFTTTHCKRSASLDHWSICWEAASSNTTSWLTRFPCRENLDPAMASCGPKF